MFKIIFPKLRKLRIVREEKGFTLVEAVISIALIGIIAAGLYTGLGTASTILLNTDSRETAKNLAETQMEFVRGQAFNPGSGTSVYVTAPIPTTQQGSYTASINVIDGASLTPVRDSYLQQVVVTITGPKNLNYSLTGYKVR
jgi:prepilin-type N-terminal cleavage/methylation domain-containing protein